MLGRTDVRICIADVCRGGGGGNERQQYKDLSPKNGTAQREDEFLRVGKTRRTPRIVTRPALAARISTT